MNATAQPASFSIFSILAIISAALSFATSAMLGLIFAGAAILFGFIGVVLSLLPKTRGGLMSFFSVLAGTAGIIVAIAKLIRTLAF